MIWINGGIGRSESGEMKFARLLAIESMKADLHRMDKNRLSQATDPSMAAATLGKEID